MPSDPLEKPSDIEKTYSIFRTEGADDRVPATDESSPNWTKQSSLGSGIDTGLFTPFDAVQANSGYPPGLILNKYRVIRKLGDGGMGTVWLVQHLTLDQQRAIKVIKAGQADDPSHRARFEQEAKILAKLKHPSAVVVHDYGFVGDVAYIDMEYLEGETLRKWIKPGVRLPLEKVEWLLGELCDVLGQAHKLGIVHRDMKPENIMILTDRETGREHVKVLDFGIAKIIQEAGADSAALTLNTEGPLGTYHYSSPEQLDCEVDSKKRRKVDHRTDIYSIGVMLYELLTGTRPFTGALTKLLHDHAYTPAPPFAEKAPESHIDPAIEKVVLKCLEKMPENRPQSARQLFELFHDAILESQPIRHDAEATTEFSGSALVDHHGRRAKALLTHAGRASFLTQLGLARPYRKKAVVGLVAASILVVLITVPVCFLVLGVIRLDRQDPVSNTTGGHLIKPRPPNPIIQIAAGAEQYLKSREYRSIAEAAILESGWPAKIQRISGTPKTLMLQGRLYLPAGYKPELLPPSPTELPLVLVGNGVRFLLIQGSSHFMMGAWKDGDPFLDVEKPGHHVELSSYYIQETEVTNGEMEQFFLETNRTKNDQQLRLFYEAKSSLLAEMTPATWQTHPAVGIPRNLAEEYAHSVGGELPSEAQWEFAARSRGQERLYVWGDDPKGLFAQDRKANVNNSGRDISTWPVSVAAEDRTDQGVLHLAGNVREWCRDVWHTYRKDQPGLDPVERPRDGETDPTYVIRGGSYAIAVPADTARVTWRADTGEFEYKAKDNVPLRDVGFRVVLEVVVVPDQRPSTAQIDQ